MWLSRPGSALVYFWAMTTLGDQTRCSRGAAVTATISTKAATSPSRPHSTVRLFWPMLPLQV